MTKQQIMTALQECAEKLGHVPSHVELMRYTPVSRKLIRRNFGSYANLLGECGLSGTGSGYKADLDDVFRDWATLVRGLKKLPSIAEYTLKSRFSVRPLILRYGTWNNAPRGLKQYAEEQGWAEEWKDVLALVDAREEQEKARGALTLGALKPAAGPDNVRWARKLAKKQGPDNARRARGDREVYGGLMRPCPLICAPVNEMGVVYLFGAMAEKLGFAVLRIRMEYPDCEALMLVEDGRQVMVKIEFEYESKNFLKHMHEASKCDLIVCWKHNWPECPLEVIELSGKLTTD
jgi:hypothetical protein